MENYGDLLKTLPRPTKLPEFHNLERLKALLQEYSSSKVNTEPPGRALVQRTIQAPQGQSLSKTIALVNQPSDRLVQADPLEAQPLAFVPDTFPRPSAEEVAREVEETRAALQVLLRPKVAKVESTTLLTFLPTNSNDTERTVMITEKPRDPLSPPRFKHKRAPAPPGSPPPPLLHSPPRRVTPTQYQAWRIPPCVSSWKNPKGYTVPLDKRLASDGRHLVDHSVNERFASLSESLYVAEGEARQELQMRAEFEQQREAEQQRLKELEMEQLLQEGAALRPTRPASSNQRPKQQMDEHLFDPRLFDRTEGITSGLANDESYNLYDRPISSARSILSNPTALVTGNAFMAESTEPDLVEASSKKESQFNKLASKDYSTPLSFDGSVESGKVAREDDPFGLDAFLTAAKRQSRK